MTEITKIEEGSQTIPLEPIIKEVIKEVEIDRPVYFDIENYEKTLTQTLNKKFDDDLKKEKEKFERSRKNL